MHESDADDKKAQEGMDAAEQAEAEFAAAFSSNGDSEGDGSGQGPDKNAQPGEPGQEPEGAAADPASEPQQPEGENELRRKAELFDAQQGRLKQEQERRRQLEEELARVRSGVAAASPAVDASAKPLAEIPEAIREDVEAFAKANPALASLAVEDSKDGERLRRTIEEYGPDHVMVEDLAERIADRRERKAQQEAERERDAASQRDAHFAPICAAHPDYAEAYHAEDPEKLKAYLGQVHQWAEGKPGKEYVEIQRVLDKGTPQEAVELLARFKAETTQRRHEPPRAAAEAGMVPRSKPSPPPKTGPSEGTFEDGWNKADAKK